MVKIRFLQNVFRITIPIDIARLVGLKKGEDVTILPDKNNKDLIVKRKR